MNEDEKRSDVTKKKKGVFREIWSMKERKIIQSGRLGGLNVGIRPDYSYVDIHMYYMCFLYLYTSSRSSQLNIKSYILDIFVNDEYKQ